MAIQHGELNLLLIENRKAKTLLSSIHPNQFDIFYSQVVVTIILYNAKLIYFCIHLFVIF